MPNPFRLSNRTCLVDAEGNSSGRPISFSFRRRRHGSTKNDNNKRPLAECSYNAILSDDEGGNSSFGYGDDGSPQKDGPQMSFAQFPLPSSSDDHEIGDINNSPWADANNLFKRQKLPNPEGFPYPPSSETMGSPNHVPLFTLAKGSPSSSLPNSFSKPAGASSRPRFESILDRPFEYWQQVNTILKEVYPSWSPYQRGRMIHHLVHFLELTIGTDEFIPTGLLLPTPVVEQVWRALVTETSLYVQITHALQDFHQKPRAIIHYTFFENRKLTPKQAEDKIRRTQSLFLVYFKEIMPLKIEDEPREPLSSPPLYATSRPCEEKTTPKFLFTTSQEDVSIGDAIFGLSSLSIQKHHGTSNTSPREDATEATAATSSSDSYCGLMGLGLLNEA